MLGHLDLAASYHGGKGVVVMRQGRGGGGARQWEETRCSCPHDRAPGMSPGGPGQRPGSRSCFMGL